MGHYGSNSKFNDDCDFKRFGKLKSGKIGLQDHGNKVSLEISKSVNFKQHPL